MLTSEKIIIKDSCILFDLIDLELMDSFFKLDLDVHTTEYVLFEVTDEEQILEVNKYVNSGKLNVDNNGEYESIQEIYNECKGLSFTDCSVLEFAIRTEGIVLSADKSLRNEIKRRKLEVRGSLWIIKELFEKNIITGNEALEKLELYSIINDRVPKNEIAILIETFKQKNR